MKYYCSECDQEIQPPKTWAAYCSNCDKYVIPYMKIQD